MTDLFRLAQIGYGIDDRIVIFQPQQRCQFGLVEFFNAAEGVGHAVGVDDVGCLKAVQDHVPDLGLVLVGQLVLLGLGAEAELVDVIDDLTQVVASMALSRSRLSRYFRNKSQEVCSA